MLSTFGRMLDGLSSQARRELERALLAHALPLPSARDRRRSELGSLSEMLHDLELQPSWSYTIIKQADYDKRRRPEAPRGVVLAKRYGGWQKACRAAYSMLPDGRIQGPSIPWSACRREPNSHRPYTLEEVLAAIRRCALELACRPTSTTYMRWAERKHQLARARGISLRIPSINTVYRHFRTAIPDRRRWQRVIATAAITDEQLADAFATRIGLNEVHLTAADELDEKSVNLLRQAGVTDASVELLQAGRAGELTLPQAILAARILSCSLDYLTGAVRGRGRPPAADVYFDRTLYVTRRKEIGVAAERVRDALSVLPREARQLALGTRSPSLREIAALEQLLSLPPGYLLAARRGATP